MIKRALHIWTELALICQKINKSPLFWLNCIFLTSKLIISFKSNNPFQTCFKKHTLVLLFCCGVTTSLEKNLKLLVFCCNTTTSWKKSQPLLKNLRTSAQKCCIQSLCFFLEGLLLHLNRSIVLLQDYYFISTSQPGYLESKEGGYCAKNNMKVTH